MAVMAFVAEVAAAMAIEEPAEMAVEVAASVSIVCIIKVVSLF